MFTTSLTEALIVKTTPDFLFVHFQSFRKFLSFTVESPLYTKHKWYHEPKHVLLSSVWKVSLKGYSRRPEPPCVLWSSHYPHWLGLHRTPPPGVAYFFLIILKLKKKKISYFTNILILFYWLNHKAFYRKTRTLNFYFSISPKNWFF